MCSFVAVQSSSASPQDAVIAQLDKVRGHLGDVGLGVLRSSGEREGAHAQRTGASFIHGGADVGGDALHDDNNGEWFGLTDAAGKGVYAADRRGLSLPLEVGRTLEVVDRPQAKVIEEAPKRLEVSQKSASMRRSGTPVSKAILVARWSLESAA